MCCPEGSFLDIIQACELVHLLIYLFLPVSEMKTQLHLLSKKGSGLLQDIACWGVWNQGCGLVLTKMGTQAQSEVAGPESVVVKSAPYWFLYCSH